MFSQQGPKRMTINNNAPQYGYQCATTGSNQSYQYSDFQMPCSNMNDNFSMYSSNSGMTASTYNSNKAKMIPDDFSNILTNCIEEILPKIAEECANSVFKQLCSELERQSEEIKQLKLQLEKIQTLPIYTMINKLSNKNSTPMKKFSNVSKDLNKIKNLIKNQNEILQDVNVNNFSNNFNNFYENLQEKIRSLQESVEEERRIHDKLNLSVKDRFVDLVSMKNFVEEKVDYLINDIKINSNFEMNHQMKDEKKVYHDVVNSINHMLEDITHNKKVRTLFSNSPVVDKPVEQNLMFTAKEMNISNNLNNYNSLSGSHVNNFSHMQNVILSNNLTNNPNSNLISHSNNYSILQNQNQNQKGKKNSKFSTFGKFTF